MSLEKLNFCYYLFSRNYLRRDSFVKKKKKNTLHKAFKYTKWSYLFKTLNYKICTFIFLT